MTRDQISNWSEKHALLMLALSAVVLFTQRMELLSLGAMISFSSFAHRGSKHLAAIKPFGGYANLITGLRLILILVASFLFSVVTPEVIFGILLGATILDMLDGFVARKTKQTTDFGSYFDREVGSFLVLLLCFYFFQYQEEAWWILIPGLMGYIFTLLMAQLKKNDNTEGRDMITVASKGIFTTILLVSILQSVSYLLVVGAATMVISFLPPIVKNLKA